jgi:putative exosortase-associated protein (TIGR04073 family)
MRNHKRTLGRSALAGAVLVGALTAAAPSAEADAGRKFGRGLSNVALGVLEIPGQIMETSQNEGLLTGLTLGTVKGVGYFVMREGAGVYELVTSPFPPYGPVISPEYPWERLE